MTEKDSAREAVAWIDDLRAVLGAAEGASSVPLQWLANTDFTPSETREWLCKAVDGNVEAGDFTGQLHSIGEEESGLVVAFTGCGPKSAANAKFLIWCVHFILKHKDALTDHASVVASLDAEVRSTEARCIELGEKLVKQMDRADAACRRVLKLEALAEAVRICQSAESEVRIHEATTHPVNRNYRLPIYEAQRVARDRVNELLRGPTP